VSGRALILGARSAIAEALARRLAAAGHPLVLAARQATSLEPVAADLRLRFGRPVDLMEYEALDLEEAATLPARVHAAYGEFDLAVQVFGFLGDQRLAEHDTAALRRITEINYTAAAVVLGHLANYLVERDRPAAIVGIGSVAGDRGRQSNYVYGAAKGALALYLQGLRHRLAATPVHVLTVKPGFVDTPMTEGMEGLFLVASPDRVATDILVALERRQNVLYTPWFWRWIMWCIRAVPEPLFKRTRL
jgi:decaprenylphospho-beta-D-erythro-pentofuranosid-2-ulose 2-reductase